MAGPTAGAPSAKFTFHSTAEFFIDRLRGGRTPSPAEEVSASSEESPAQSSTLQEQASSPLNKQLPIFPPEIWLQIGKALSTINGLRDFVRLSSTHFYLGYEVMAKKFQPRSVEEAVELFKLVHSKHAKPAFDPTNPDYEARHNRLLRELFSCDFSKLPRGNFIKIAELLLSGTRHLTFQNWIDMGFLDQQELADTDPNTRLSPEHAFYFFNNLITLLIQKPKPNMIAFSRIPSAEILLEIAKTPDETRALKFDSYMFLDPLNAFGEPLYTQTFLNWAVTNNNLARAQQLIEADVNIDAISPQGGSALHSAVEHHLVEMFNFLIRQGASLETHDEHGDTPLLAMIQNPLWTVNDIQFVIEAGDNFAKESGTISTGITLLTQSNRKCGSYALQLADRRRFSDKVKYLVEYADKSNLLHTAVHYGDVDLLKLLAEYMREQFNEHKETLQNIAVDQSDLSMFECVIEEGGDSANIREIKQRILVDAIHTFNVNRVKALLKLDETLANPIDNEDSYNPLFKATGRKKEKKRWAKKRLQILETLLNHGAKIDSAHGIWNPLTFAVTKGQIDIVKLFVTSKQENIYARPDPSYRHKILKEALLVAAENYLTDIFNVIIKSPNFDRSLSPENLQLLAQVVMYSRRSTEPSHTKRYEPVYNLANHFDGGRSVALLGAQAAGYLEVGGMLDYLDSLFSEHGTNSSDE